MTNPEPYTLESAIRAGAEDRLAEWVCAFLASPGSDNAPLAAALAMERKWWLGPVRFELDQLTPLAGPDEDEVLVPIEEDEWEHDVDEMKASLAEGWEPPPLLVSHHDGGFFLEDGNHRHETLRRAGASDAWAIVWFDAEEDREQFVASLENSNA